VTIQAKTFLSALSAALAVIVIIGVVASDVFSVSAGRNAACGALLVFVAIEARSLVRGGRIMLAVCLATAAATLLWDREALPLLGKALGDAAFIIALFASLSLLRDAAESSALIQSCGAWMVHQPPGRRYLVLNTGSHLISLVLNFGVLPLLGTMVLKGNTLEAAGGDTQVAAIRTRRMMTAILRGYCMMTVWSPLAVAFAVTQVAIPGLDWWRLLPMQFVLACLLMALGWQLDRRAFPRRASAQTENRATNVRPLVALTALIATVVAAAVIWAEILSVRPVVGAMMVVPVAALIWLTVQHWQTRGLAAPLTAVQRLAFRLTQSMPAFRNEFVILGGAMFFGRLVSAFLSPELTARAIGWLPLPPVVVSILLAWGMMLLARYGISQIITVTLLGGAIANLTQLGIHPLVLASGMLGAWSLSATTTPIGAAALTVARMSGVSTDTVAREWNGLFVIAGALLLAVWMLLLALVL
jgi:hypothetical protein